MPIYLVRTIKERDLVGIFAAPNVMDLAFLIDEVLDPDRCEYQRLPSGGIVWDSRAVSVPIEAAGDDDDPDEDPENEVLVPWGGARSTETWSNFLYGGAGSKWMKINVSLEDLYGIDPETPEPEPPPKPVRTRKSASVLPFRKG
ncbi:hypothetical protein ABIB82_004070 [Bradyrhizobium sp. i1.8.4]|uniref:hypothetical protein n=1 Tax=unclassified Bradyrhizobium TaxID=2631580 RepID=UPI003D1AF12A